MGCVNDWGRVISAVIARRSDLGLTQRELAAKAAVAERTVQNLEAGKRPQPLIRGKIERALGWEAGEMERIAARKPEAPPQPPAISPSLLASIRKEFPDDPAAQQRVIDAVERTMRGEPPPGAQAGADESRDARRAAS
jgi:transcriptional regulator with XRE-family HTH domain